MTDQIKKILQDLASQLPVVMESSYEVHIMTGTEILSTGAHEFEGEPIDPEKKYRYPMPVQVAANHYRRLKDAYNKGGQPAVFKYIEDLKTLAVKHQNKEVCQKKSSVPIADKVRRTLTNAISAIKQLGRAAM